MGHTMQSPQDSSCESTFPSGHPSLSTAGHQIVRHSVGPNPEELKSEFDGLVVKILASNVGEYVAWPYGDCHDTCDAFLEFAGHYRLLPLIHHRLSTSGVLAQWPETIVRGLVSAIRTEAAYQMLRDRDVVRLAAGCQANGIAPIFFKGYALANTVYPTPRLRPSVDVDLIVRPSEIETVVVVLEGIGFERFSPYRGQLHSNEVVCRRRTQGTMIEFDCHFEINNRPLLAQLLSYDELRQSATCPGDRNDILVPSLKHSLLLACIHRTAHGNTEDLLWLYDFAYLAEGMTNDERRDFVVTCRRKNATQICHYSLKAAAETLNKPLLMELADQLTSDTGEVEPTAVYLRESRSAVGDAMIRWQSLNSKRAKITYCRELLLPSQNFLNWKYGIEGRWRRLRNGFELVRMALTLLVGKSEKPGGEQQRQGPTHHAN